MAMKKLQSAHPRVEIYEKNLFNHTVFSLLHIHQITVDGYNTCRDFVLAKSGENKVGQ